MKNIILFIVFLSFVYLISQDNVSRLSGLWNNCSTWGNPTKIYNSIFSNTHISSGNTVTANVNWSIKELILNNNSAVNLNSNVVLNFQNNSGSDYNCTSYMAGLGMHPIKYKNPGLTTGDPNGHGITLTFPSGNYWGDVYTTSYPVRSLYCMTPNLNQNSGYRTTNPARWDKPNGNGTVRFTFSPSPYTITFFFYGGQRGQKWTFTSNVSFSLETYTTCPANMFSINSNSITLTSNAPSYGAYGAASAAMYVTIRSSSPITELYINVAGNGGGGPNIFYCGGNNGL